MIDLVIRNGRVVTPTGVIRDGVAVAGETIVAIGADQTLPVCEVSVYRGWTLRGLARRTIVRGRVMMDDRVTVGSPGWGRHRPRGRAAGKA